MRVLGYSERWLKLQKPIHTTFRLPRKDKDWEFGEIVQEVYQPRSKGREVLGTAVILSKDKRCMLFGVRGSPHPTEEEAEEDGFKDLKEMWLWLRKAHGAERLLREPINKLTLRKLP